MEATFLALVRQVFQSSCLYCEPEQHLVSVFIGRGHLITCLDLWGSEYFTGSPYISEKYVPGGPYFSAFYWKISSGGIHFRGVHFYHDSSTCPIVLSPDQIFQAWPAALSKIRAWTLSLEYLGPNRKTCQHVVTPIRLLENYEELSFGYALSQIASLRIVGRQRFSFSDWKCN